MNPSKCLVSNILVLLALTLCTVVADELPTLKEAPNRKALQAQIADAQEALDAFGFGHIIVGRVVLDGPGDSQDVYAQMLILEGGYFASATKDLVRPVGFHMHGYIPFDLELKGRSGARDAVNTAPGPCVL